MIIVEIATNSLLCILIIRFFIESCLHSDTHYQVYNEARDIFEGVFLSAPTRTRKHWSGNQCHVTIILIDTLEVV